MALLFQAGTHQARANLGARNEAWDFARTLPGLEGFVKLLALAIHLHHYVQCIIGGADLRSAHLLHQPVGEGVVSMADTSTQQGVVDDGILHHVRLLHVPEDFDCFVHVPLDTVSLHDGGTCDDVRDHSIRFHGRHELRHSVHEAATRKGIDARSVDNGVHPEALSMHLAPHGHRIASLVGNGENLQDC